MEKSKISSKTWQMENCKNALKKKLRAKHLAKHVKKEQKTANGKITKKKKSSFKNSPRLWRVKKILRHIQEFLQSGNHKNQ